MPDHPRLTTFKGGQDLLGLHGKVPTPFRSKWQLARPINLVTALLLSQMYQAFRTIAYHRGHRFAGISGATTSLTEWSNT